jgi:sugar phosphate isomerase/epimerase
MNKQLRIRIGTQSAFTAVPFLAPFYYAAEHGFDAFEWLPDMKDSGAGWLEKDVDPRTRLFIKETSAEYDIRLSVHAPWHLNLANPDHRIRLAETLEFARQIGATLLNVHLYNEHKPNAYIEGVLSLTDFLVDNDMILSMENTPYTAPHDFNVFFKNLKQIAPNALSCVGMCLDIGHANLCAATRNDYLGFIDTLATEVPIIHVHLHENYGDFDSHLTVFTGPAQKDGRGIEGLIKRLKRRSFCGSIILEQWPDPPSQLDEARDRLQAMLYGDPSSAAEGAFPEKNSTGKNLDEDTF